MQRVFFAVLCCAFLGLASLATAQQATLVQQPDVSRETKELLKRWLSVCRARAELANNDRKCQERDQFLARPDADLCLAHYLVEVPFDWGFWIVADELGNRNTQRAFDFLLPRLTSRSNLVGQQKVEILGKFPHMPEAGAELIALLHDPDQLVRSKAALSLRDFENANVEEALVRAVESSEEWVSTDAVCSLAAKHSDAGVGAVVKLLMNAPTDKIRCRVLWGVMDYRKKAITQAVLAAYARTPQPKLSTSDRRPDLNEEQRLAAAVMAHCFNATGEVLGPKPDDFYEEWQDWWDRVEPLLTDDLKLKAPIDSPPPQHADAEFSKNPDDLELEIAADGTSFREGDPIRLDLTFNNRGNKPCRTVVPELIAYRVGRWEYTIRLLRDGQVVVQTDPRRLHMGSASPLINVGTIEARQTYRCSRCLQGFLGYELREPLKEGRYQLELTFDPGILERKTDGVELVHAWKSKPISFQIVSGPRTDPETLLGMIAEKTRLPFIVHDISSPTYERRERAQRAFWEYADRRFADAESLPGWMRKRIHDDLYLRE
jgi:hypothetical protein